MCNFCQSRCNCNSLARTLSNLFSDGCCSCNQRRNRAVCDCNNCFDSRSGATSTSRSNGCCSCDNGCNCSQARNGCGCNGCSGRDSCWSRSGCGCNSCWSRSGCGCDSCCSRSGCGCNSCCSRSGCGCDGGCSLNTNGFASCSTCNACSDAYYARQYGLNLCYTCI